MNWKIDLGSERKEMPHTSEYAYAFFFAEQKYTGRHGRPGALGNYSGDLYQRRREIKRDVAPFACSPFIRGFFRCLGPVAIERTTTGNDEQRVPASTQQASFHVVAGEQMPFL